MESFVWMAVASALHFGEEFIYPGGFLRWMRVLFPHGAITRSEAVAINFAFFLLVLSPLWDSPAATPVLSLSIPSLLVANGVLHVLGTFVTRQYSPGVVTAVLLYFPTATYALLTIPRQWNSTRSTVVAGVLLGFGWQLIPLVRLAARQFTKSRTTGGAS